MQEPISTFNKIILEINSLTTCSDLFLHFFLSTQLQIYTYCSCVVHSASPENSCFNEASVAERLKQHFDIVVNAATNGDVDKVFRSHCGEGFALYDKGKYFKYYKSGVTAFWDNTWANKYNDKNENKFLLKEGELGKLCKTVKKNYKDQKHIQLVHCGYFPLSGDMYE